MRAQYAYPAEKEKNSEPEGAKGPLAITYTWGTRTMHKWNVTQPGWGDRKIGAWPGAVGEPSLRSRGRRLLRALGGVPRPEGEPRAVSKEAATIFAIHTLRKERNPHLRI